MGRHTSFRTTFATTLNWNVRMIVGIHGKRRIVKNDETTEERI
jgi:hypothetical protein